MDVSRICAFFQCLQNFDFFSALQNGWFICSKSKSFAVFATTPIEKQQWIDHISRAVQEHIREGSITAQFFEFCGFL